MDIIRLIEKTTFISVINLEPFVVERTIFHFWENGKESLV